MPTNNPQALNSLRRIKMGLEILDRHGFTEVDGHQDVVSVGFASEEHPLSEPEVTELRRLGWEPSEEGDYIFYI